MILDEHRKILFRGKTTNTNTWVYGYPCAPIKIIGIEHPYEISATTTRTRDVGGIFVSRYNESLYREAYEVYLKTIGQYTEFKDCTGVMIFEHDIVHCRTYPHLMRNKSKKRLDGIPKEVTGQVVMHNGAWVVKNNRRMCFPLGDVYSVKVLGNVFDDFELLEEQE